ncbi:RNA polymerase sigma factor [Brevibacillus humidisoli]|uniref:RNA polymerase sigma factor n=1 Tax=Brevibacillus humidisoli TaxID=2895522 RepID=UPI002105E641|nr:sigma-70 family RNA polymerase sigma factor [Brevibacillus humidisoli]
MDEALLPEQQLLIKESRSQLWEQVYCLTTDQAKLLSLKYQRGLKTREIAAILGKSVNSIKVSHYRALKQLQRRLAFRRQQYGMET